MLLLIAAPLFSCGHSRGSRGTCRVGRSRSYRRLACNLVSRGINCVPPHFSDRCYGDCRWLEHYAAEKRPVSTRTDKSRPQRRPYSKRQGVALLRQPADWRTWLAEHGGGLILLARQWADCHTDAEDIVQEAFVRFWPKRRSVRRPEAYLYACVRRAAMDFQRSAERRRRREQDARAGTRTSASAEELFERTAEQDARRVIIERALTALPEAQREVVVMKLWGELTFECIGSVLDISPNTAASRYRRAIRALRDSLSAFREVQTP